MTLPPVYSPAEVEKRWYLDWETKGRFKPDLNAREGPFTIVIPPPNVTGILHMGHALNNTLQDVLIRYKRMRGFATLWVPGTDHAGIATQNVVERELAKEKVSRQQLGREAFIQRVWTWKEKYGSTIVQQLRRLGASCDWSRERFTMDDGLSRAVETAFLKLYEAGLIYRGYYLVNWCPRCQTALSDEEVQHEEIQGHLYYIRYPAVEGQRTEDRRQRTEDRRQRTEDRRQRTEDRRLGKRGEAQGVVVATTRPETLLGDVAVAVNPDDERYRSLIGAQLVLPLVKKPIPVIADQAVDPKFGTGAVKITPAHDPVDFELARRHLELIPKEAARQDWTSIPINVMLPDARMTNVPAPYEGLDRFECRKRVIEDLVSEGLLEKTEEYRHAVGHCYRCRTIVEPRLSPQWFVKMEPLAKLGIEAVERDGMRFIPDRWTKVYLDWLKNIRDWCISRQIWWGHRIPVWTCRRCSDPAAQGLGNWHQDRYTEPGMVVAQSAQMKSAPPTCPTCGKSNQWVQDPDVLDTWFSSWLWPFSTLGWPEGRGAASSSGSRWPEETKDLSTFYPTSVLVTGQDIIFFWVARMVMAGKFFLKQIPFRDVYIHGIIRVEGGKKMSKSLGNIIDPLEVIDRMGADALRFSLAHMASEGQDLYLSEEKFLLGRNFANKLWNAARLILEKSTISSGEPAPFNPRSMTIPDRWLLSRFQRMIQQVTQALEAYQFSETARLLYQFLWHEFCDWYLEIAKLQREEKDTAILQNTDRLLQTVLEGVLRLLHPILPFITEEVWRKVQRTEDRGQRTVKDSIMLARWPEPNLGWIDPEAEEAFARVQSVITEVRNLRATFRVPVQQKVTLIVRGQQRTDLVSQHEKLIERLAGVDRVSIVAEMKRPAGSIVSHLPAESRFDPWELIVPLAGLVDLQVERQRIQKEMEALQSRAQSKRSRLQDPTFRSRAPSEVIEVEVISLKALETEMAKWAESLKQLGV